MNWEFCKNARASEIKNTSNLLDLKDWDDHLQDILDIFSDHPLEDFSFYFWCSSHDYSILWLILHELEHYSYSKDNSNVIQLLKHPQILKSEFFFCNYSSKFHEKSRFQQGSSKKAFMKLKTRKVRSFLNAIKMTQNFE